MKLKYLWRVGNTLIAIPFVFGLMFCMFGYILIEEVWKEKRYDDKPIWK